MNFRFAGATIQLVRPWFDGILNTSRFEVIGQISRLNGNVKIADRFEVSVAEKEAIEDYKQGLARLETLRDEEAFLALAEQAERVARHLDRIEDEEAKQRVAAAVLFVSTELRRIARRIVDGHPSKIERGAAHSVQDDSAGSAF